MCFSCVLAVVAVSTASISASDASSERCPFFSLQDTACSACVNLCVSISSLPPGFNHVNWGALSKVDVSEIRHIKGLCLHTQKAGFDILVL
ncbi:uncharacterized protein EDB91DRAFT_1106423 [Suillus paluster]|uniref:uncharacterized protein n=1 Tax=Suillus paluster TaxID=48578 RepID=UPI001B886B1D|nr:uncharacterized protein EDB91DRAFT_1106423 [Suillus paluster]KAG1751633.1 hypothetical protein EDB91DRAFT_1106423 [Suillus paluster]